MHVVIEETDLYEEKIISVQPNNININIVYYIHNIRKSNLWKGQHSLAELTDNSN